MSRTELAFDASHQIAATVAGRLSTKSSNTY